MDPERPGFDDFFRETFDKIVKFLVKDGYAYADAQDAAAAAMAYAFVNWSTIESPAPWAFQAALRIAGRDRARDRDGVEKMIKSFMSLSATYSDQILFTGEEQRVIKVLRELPEQQRRVFALLMDGYRPSEIGQILDMLPHTVRSNLRHARAKLKVVYSCREDLRDSEEGA